MYGLDDLFPNLSKDNHTLTSPQTSDYNCIAWAAAVDDQWWWPASAPAAYWPNGIRNDVTVEAFIEAFTLMGYQLCENDSLESGIEKVALFIDDNNIPQHMSRQLISGDWTTKLGNEWDLTHSENKVLEGPGYGKAKYFFSRKATVITI